jgi:TrbL/VirB6 plasmid conjugal transfer protein
VTARRLAILAFALLTASGLWGASAALAADRSPSSPPLTASESNTAPSANPTDEQSSGAVSPGEADPLVSNGLGSPSCKDASIGELSSTDRRNCETSGFAAAPAPTGDYGIDVHIEDSVLSPGSWGYSVAQELLIAPLWMGLVWAVHALVVMLEWSFTIDLLDSGAAAGIGRGLRQMQATFTEPWLPLVLAVASVLALYQGLIRRRVAETVAEAALMVAMMVGGIWIISDPTGTVGALGQWANQASLGTLAVASQGTPAAPARALGDSLDTVFSVAIEAPWCYLEFGDVGWCREPSQLDPRLRAAGLKLADEELALRSCEPSWTALIPCAKATNAQARALEHSSELLHAAQSNGALFLALPANGPARNSISESGSLLRALCQSSEATSCRGPTAAQAEFRTASATMWRIAGVLLIAAGLLGMLLLLGFIAVQLVISAASSLIYLLLAPAAVLAPAFGEAGRTLFRKWLTRLLGAVISKLLFSFLLGILLAVVTVLSELQAIGWWTQWLLISAFWWSAFTHRHQLLGVAEGSLTQRRGAGEHAQRHSLMRRVRAVVESNHVIAAARWAKDRRAKQAADVEPRNREKRARAANALARAGADEQVRRSLDGEQRDAGARMESANAINSSLAGKRAQLERLGRERSAARSSGDTRRAARLGVREARVKGEIDREQGALNRARELRGEAQLGGREPHTSERRNERARFLDAQAALPSAARARGAEQRRDYGALSSLAGYRREEYERLDPAGQRVARLEIDRELALRKGFAETATSLAEPQGPRLGRIERHRAERKFDGALQKRMREDGHGMPASRTRRSPFDAWREDARAEQAGRRPSSDRSSVMRDAREVAARRKRQLGKGRP